MIQKIKKPISIVLALMMIVSLFAIVPITASAAVGDIVPESDYLTFTAVEAGASVTLKVASGNSFQYDLNGTGLTDYTLGTEITLANVGDYVRFRGKDTRFNASQHVSIGGKVACSGNVMSLRLDEDGRDQGLYYGCFNYMFSDCTGLTAAPELPETTLANRCYDCMFFGCTNLTVAPELPATTLATGCYSSMFAGCTSLTTAPELPATTLATGCYERMFYACTSLTTAPELPATTLVRNCYSYMFAGCERLTTAPELPATTLATGCYERMFYRCSSIKLSETQTDEYSIPYSVPSGGNGTTATDALKNMFYKTGGTFTGTPEINKTYYLYREVPKYTVTWKNGDDVLETDTDVAEGTTPTYDGETPTKASDKYYDYTFSGWSDDSNTYAADALPAVSGDVTYTAQFTATAKTFKAYAKNLTGGTYTIENLTGETTVAQLKEIIADQIDIPATAQRLIFAGKELEDAKTLAEYNIQKESTIHLVIRGYTVTWKNGDDVLETDTGVAKDSTPSYDGKTPYKADGADCIYTFSGWNDGTTTYAPNELPAVSGNATYTATFTESEKPEVIKDCDNKFGDFRLYSNVPIVSFSNVNDLLTGAIIPITYGDSNTMIPVQDAKGYSYKFYDQTGTEIPAQITDSSSAPGSNYELSDDVTVYTNVINFTRPAGCTAIYIVATAPAPTPAPANLILNVGENGKVVMDNGTFGNATDASNISEIPAPVNVADGYKAIIVDGHSLNLVEGGSINIAAGGEVSFYPSADNTGKITAIPNEGYICTGWYNGDTRYTKKDTIDYQAISEDMTLTAKFAPKLFPQHSVTLGGDIGVNFYINPAAAGANEQAAVSVEFSWNGQTKTVVAKYDGDEELFKATCDVVAAEVACDITAVATVNGEVQAQTDTYSVQDYAETVYKNPEAYDKKGKPQQLQELAKALLNYGAMAQTVFVEYMKQPVKDPAKIVSTVGKTDFTDITADDIPGGATDLKDIATQLGCQYYTSSVLYLSKNTLRLYFTPNTYQGTMPHVNDFKGNQSEYYYYVEKENIAAAELDDQQTFKVGGKEFTFSALDYAKAVVNSDMKPDQKDLAKSLYLYNKAANEYFDATPAPAQKIVDLSTLTGNYEAQNNDVLTGTLEGDKQITIADGATVTLRNANITLNDDASYAGITPLGDATILLEGTNTVMGGYGYPGVYSAEGATLTIDGTGSLTASSNGFGAGIGSGLSGVSTTCGDITINGGTITANGASYAAGIGSGYQTSACGNITINGGTITANGGSGAPGIGSGTYRSSCGNITINGGTVDATGGDKSPAIGGGNGDYNKNQSKCGNITIADTVTKVTATKGSNALNTIGAGYSVPAFMTWETPCGTITIGGVEGAISTSPYTYQP